MSRPTPLLLLAVFTLLAFEPGEVMATTVPPDSTSPPLEAIDCLYSSGSLENVGDLDCPVTVCATACDAAANRAKLGFNVSNYTIGRRFVQTTAYTEFTVDPGTNGAGHELDGTIGYDVEWRGIWVLTGLLTGFNEVKCSVTLLLWDRSAGGKLVKQAQLHQLDAIAAGSLPAVGVEVGAGLDHGDVTNTLTAKVIRGHTYRAGLRIRAEGKGAPNATVNLDYIDGDKGAWWNELTVAISPDLEERIRELERRVTLLEEQLVHHTHHYLTGRGEGHNNTEAITSEAILVDSGEPTAEELMGLPKERLRAQPLPVQSVVRSGATNPSGPVATIHYTLPEALPVSIRVYDALGRIVSDLLESDQAGGAHEVRFEAAGLPAGVYYYRIVAGPYSETRKLTLLK